MADKWSALKRWYYEPRVGVDSVGRKRDTRPDLKLDTATVKRLLKGLGLLIGLVALPVVIVTVTFLIRGGAFRDVSAVSAGQCEAIAIPDGSAEDVQPDRRNNLALLSVLDRRAIVNNTASDGTISRLSLDNPAFPIVPALASQPSRFQPHGISLYEAADGTQTLFVINHSFGAGEYIELFEKTPEQNLFDHVDTLSSPLLIEPNDLVAVGSRQFYVANDSGASNGLERVAEMVFAVGLSPLVYYDGSNFEMVIENLKSSGGINVDPARSKLYVGETVGEAIRVFALNTDGSLGPEKEAIPLDSGVDNIDVDVDGNIWIANHTNTVALVQHFADETSPAPTQVQRISFTGDQPNVETIYEQDGSAHSAGSVAVRYDDAFLIGSITEKQLLYCQMKEE